MPDLTIHAAWTCSSNVSWKTIVAGSRGASYTVRYGLLFGRDAEFQGCLYGYTCSCPAFTKSRNSHLPCKHILDVKTSGARCAWNWELEPGAECDHDSNGDSCCPDCGGPLDVFNVGV